MSEHEQEQQRREKFGDAVDLMTKLAVPGWLSIVVIAPKGTTCDTYEYHEDFAEAGGVVPPPLLASIMKSVHRKLCSHLPRQSIGGSMVCSCCGELCVPPTRTEGSREVPPGVADSGGRGES